MFIMDKKLSSRVALVFVFVLFFGLGILYKFPKVNCSEFICGGTGLSLSVIFLAFWTVGLIIASIVVYWISRKKSNN